MPPQPALDQRTPPDWVQSASAQAGTEALNFAELQHWWLRLADPSLNALVDEALARNMRLGEALERLRAQRIVLSAAASSYRPELTAGLYTVQDVAAQDSYFHASLNMNWELGLFGASQSKQLAAYGQLLGAAAQLHQVRVEVIAHVVQRYLDIRLTQRQQALLDERITLQQRLVALSGVRLAQGLDSADTLHQMQLALAKAQSQRARHQEIQAHAAHALATLLGRQQPDPHWLELDASATLPATQALQLRVLPADMLRMRAAIQLAQAQVEQAAAQVGLSRAALYPRIALEGSLLYAFNVTHNRRSSSDQLPILSPVIDIPLFDWGYRQAQVDANEAAMQAALKAYRHSVLEGLAEVESALASLHAQTQRLESLSATKALLTERSRVLQRRLQLGLASEYNLLSEQQAYLDNASEQGLAMGAQALAYVAVFKALGGAPLPADNDGAQPLITQVTAPDAAELPHQGLAP